MWSYTKIKFILKLVYSRPLWTLSNLTRIIWFTIFYFSVGWLFVYYCSGLFPGGRRAEAPRSAMHSPAPGHGPVLRPPTPETARTAPATVSTTLLIVLYTTLRKCLLKSLISVYRGTRMICLSISLNNSTQCISHNNFGEIFELLY